MSSEVGCGAVFLLNRLIRLINERPFVKPWILMGIKMRFIYKTAKNLLMQVDVTTFRGFSEARDWV